MLLRSARTKVLNSCRKLKIFTPTFFVFSGRFSTSRVRKTKKKNVGRSVCLSVCLCVDTITRERSVGSEYFLWTKWSGGQGEELKSFWGLYVNDFGYLPYKLTPKIWFFEVFCTFLYEIAQVVKREVVENKIPRVLSIMLFLGVNSSVLTFFTKTGELTPISKKSNPDDKTDKFT